MPAPPANGKAVGSPDFIRRRRAAARRASITASVSSTSAQYNKSYNYFAGMPDEDVAKHQKDDTIGHRPTWFVGVNLPAAIAPGGTASGPQRLCLPFHHPRSVRAVRRQAQAQAPNQAPSPSGRSVRPSGNACASSISRTAPPRRRSRRASRTWLNVTTPTATGGDRRSEDKLREVIQAYNYLRQAGLA